LLGRRGVGIELSQRYFADAMYYLDRAERGRHAPTLFDLDADDVAAAQAATA
jgi:hypothetical protein